MTGAFAGEGAEDGRFLVEDGLTGADEGGLAVNEVALFEQVLVGEGAKVGLPREATRYIFEYILLLPNRQGDF